MEASQSADPFVEEPGTDPFAEEEAAATEEPPVVDREGQPVAASEAGKRMAAEAAQAPAEAPPKPEAPTEAAPKPEAAQAPPQAEAAPRRGEATKRLYKLLYQTDVSQWTEAPLGDWAQSEYVVQEDGDYWITATNADQVRRVGFVLFQRPQDGVTLMPVAKGAWKPVRVKTRQVPTRERLEFDPA